MAGMRDYTDDELTWSARASAGVMRCEIAASSKWRCRWACA